MLTKITTLSRRSAVTMLELLVVVLIIGILATVATGIYTGETEKARVAATHAMINQLSMAITRYEVDLGAYPPGGSGAPLAPGAPASRRPGSGYLYLALVHSLSGNAYTPASPRWKGPYINLQADQVGLPSASQAGEFDILDAWGSPIRYFNRNEYLPLGAARIFQGGRPAGANPDLPASSPFGETFYNSGSYQLISFGPNTTSLLAPYEGTENDDVTNFGF